MTVSDLYLERRGRDDFRNWVGQLDLLDEQGRYIGSIDFDPLERLLTIGPDGSLYTRVFEPEPQIRRYEVGIFDRLRIP